MFRLTVIFFTFAFVQCSTKYISCSGNAYSNLDSLLAIKDVNNENSFFYNPDFHDKFRHLLCKRIGQFKTILIFEIQPRFDRERKGIIYNVDNYNFFSFYQKMPGRKLRFFDGDGENAALRLLAVKIKDTFESSTDSLKNLYKRLSVKDGSLLRITRISLLTPQKTISSIIIPYVPDIILNKRDLDAFGFKVSG